MGAKTIKSILSVGACAALLMSCADVPSTGPQPPEVRAEFRFVHAASDLGNVQVAVDGTAQGDLAFGASLGYKTFPAGSREVALSNGEKQFVAMSTDLRGTVALLPSIGGAAREFFRISERRIFDTPQTAVRVLNFNPNLNVEVRVIAGADTVTNASLAYKGDTGYRVVSARDYTIEVKEAGKNVVLASAPLSVSTSHTAMILSNAGTVNIVSLSDN